MLYGRVTDSIREKHPSLAGLFRTLLKFIAELWLVYPVIWVLAPSGPGLTDLETQSMVVRYIGVVAKIDFGLIARTDIALATYLDAESVETDAAVAD